MNITAHAGEGGGRALPRLVPVNPTCVAHLAAQRVREHDIGVAGELLAELLWPVRAGADPSPISNT